MFGEYGQKFVDRRSYTQVIELKKEKSTVIKSPTVCYSGSIPIMKVHSILYQLAGPTQIFYCLSRIPAINQYWKVSRKFTQKWAENYCDFLVDSSRTDSGIWVTSYRTENFGHTGCSTFNLRVTKPLIMVYVISISHIDSICSIHLFHHLRIQLPKLCLEVLTQLLTRTHWSTDGSCTNLYSKVQSRSRYRFVY